MELSITTLLQFASILSSGLIAGFLFAWQVSVIPGNKLVSNQTYLETMQNINRAILNPAFFLFFIGSVPVLILHAIYQTFSGFGMYFWISVSATIFYMIGVFVVTGVGNVPLNNELDQLKLSTLSEHDQSKFRIYYESNWNRLHTIRTWFSILVFALLILTVFI